VPSAFAHLVVGSALGCALPADLRFRKTAIVLLAAAAAAPDLDVIGFRLGIPYASPLGHRGLTHSLGFAALIGLASLPLWRLPPNHVRSRTAGSSHVESSHIESSRLWPWGAVLAFLVVGSHGLLDTFTDDGLGVGLFIPFDSERYFAPWRPIETSPLSVRAFFSQRGLEILANEARWVGLPCLGFLATLNLTLRLCSRESVPVSRPPPSHEP